MLSETLIVCYNNDTPGFEIRDKTLVNVVDTFALPNAQTVWHWRYDEYRQLLWIYTNSNKIYRIHIDWNGSVITRTTQLELDNVSIPNMNTTYTNQMVINPNTGDLYIAGSASANVTVGWIKFDGIDYEKTLYIPRSYYYTLAHHILNIFIDPVSHNIMIAPEYQYENNSLASSRTYRTWAVVKPDLSNWKAGSSLYNMVYSLYPTSRYTYVYGATTSREYWNNTMDNEFNPITELTLGCGAIAPATLNSYKVKNDVLLWATKPMELYQVTNQYKTSVNVLTGYTYIFTDNHLIVLNRNLESIHEITWQDFDSGYLMYDKYRNVIYRYSSSRKLTNIYNGFGQLIGSYQYSGFAPTRFLIMNGADFIEESYFNIIIEPKDVFKYSNYTPTIVARVGIGPKGYTQQFRLVGDQNNEKVQTGLPTDTYTIMADSWSAGSNYVDWNWEYSIDYNEATKEGTWLPLGTDSPTKSGGIEPDNGLDCHCHFTRYVRCTIPEASQLTGEINSQDWYFKIYSILE